MKSKKMIAGIVLLMMAAGSLAGCGSSQQETETSAAGTIEGEKEEGKKQENVTISLWSHLTEAELDGIKPIAEEWAAKNNAKVEIVSDKSDRQAYIQAAQSPSGPDVMYGMGHDNLGTFQKAGVLAEVPEGMINKDDYTSEQLLDAVTIEGKQYAIPIAQETCALFYNKDLVSEVPATMEDLEEMAKGGLGFQFDVADLYRSWGIIAAQGGYVFKNNNGTLDVTDIGLANEGAVKGYEYLQNLVCKDGLMAADIDDNVAKTNFENGSSAFYISGPWDISVFKEAGVNYGVVPMPAFGGKPCPTFMGVQAAFVSANSKHQDLAWDLISYLNENAMDQLVTIGNRIPATKKGVASEAFTSLEYMDQFAKQAENGEPMPNIAEMQAVWTPSRNCITALMAGEVTPEEMGNELVKQVQEGIAQQN